MVVPFDAVAPIIPPVIDPIDQLNVAPETLLVNAILVDVALQIVVGLIVVTFGVGLTVTTILSAVPGQEFAVGVTIYVTVPAVVPGLVSVCAMVVPFDAVAPIIPPVIVPIVQLKFAPETLLVNAILVDVALQIVVGLTVVTFGVGLTVTTILVVLPGHELATGVTIYVTVPAVVPGLISICEIVDPLDALAPVIPPVIEPMVHEKLLGALDVNVIFGSVPLQVVAVVELVTAGVGLTVTTILYGLPTHDPVVEVGVTRYSTVPAVELLGFVRI
jgi:uncharacterized protein Usg